MPRPIGRGLLMAAWCVMSLAATPAAALAEPRFETSPCPFTLAADQWGLPGEGDLLLTVARREYATQAVLQRLDAGSRHLPALAADERNAARFHRFV